MTLRTNPCPNGIPLVTRSSLLSTHTPPPPSQASQVKPPLLPTSMMTKVSSQAYLLSPGPTATHVPPTKERVSLKYKAGHTIPRLWQVMSTLLTVAHKSVHVQANKCHMLACPGQPLGTPFSRLRVGWPRELWHPHQPCPCLLLQPRLYCSPSCFSRWTFSRCPPHTKVLPSLVCAVLPGEVHLPSIPPSLHNSYWSRMTQFEWHFLKKAFPDHLFRFSVWPFIDLVKIVTGSLSCTLWYNICILVWHINCPRKETIPSQCPA